MLYSDASIVNDSTGLILFRKFKNFKTVSSKNLNQFKKFSSIKHMYMSFMLIKIKCIDTCHMLNVHILLIWCIKHINVCFMIIISFQISFSCSFRKFSNVQNFFFFFPYRIIFAIAFSNNGFIHFEHLIINCILLIPRNAEQKLETKISISSDVDLCLGLSHDFLLLCLL